MLLHLLGKVLPGDLKQPKYYRMGKETGITWLSPDEGIIFGTEERPGDGDVIMSLRNNGNTKFFVVTTTNDYKLEEGKAAWIGFVDEVTITKDNDGWPEIKVVKKQVSHGHKGTSPGNEGHSGGDGSHAAG